MSRFTGRVAIVTGAASGIGKEIALRLAAEGGIPVIADLNLDAANATANEIKALYKDKGGGGDSFAVAMNVPTRPRSKRASPTPWPSTARSTSW